MMNIESKLPQRLKEVRLDNKLSQKRLGEILGYSQQCIALWEAGTRNPTPDDICALCKSLNVSADYLLGIED